MEHNFLSSFSIHCPNFNKIGDMTAPAICRFGVDWPYYEKMLLVRLSKDGPPTFLSPGWCQVNPLYPILNALAPLRMWAVLNWHLHNLVFWYIVVKRLMFTLDSPDLVPRIILSIPDILRTRNGMGVFQPKPTFVIRFFP